MASLTDWLARTFYIDQENIDTSNQVRDAQQAILDRQVNTGVIGPIRYYGLSNEVQDTGETFYDEELGKPGAAGLPGLALSYWWVFALIGAALFFYFGGLPWLKRQFKR
jgi:hypothetical protein